MTLASGTRLGTYEITAKLGEGGMGEVYRATDRKLRREVAIKVLPAAFTEDRERLDRFEREARVLASLNHPNIGAIYGLEESEGVRALVMELVEGPTLAERLAAGLSLDQSLAIALQITHALEEAHEKGIVHRDLKPQNVKASIDGLEGKVKVLDFGLAKAMQPRSSAAMSPADLEHSPTVTMGGTREGMILGTAAYMAPEQARGAAVDKRADIWAFGVVLYEMLAGERLFAERSVVDTLSAVMRKEIDLGRLPPSVPPRIRELVGRCLERDPKRRLRDIGEARMALSDPSAGSLPGPVAATAPPAASRALVLGAAIAVGAALLGWLALRQRGTTIEGQAAPVRTVRFQVPPPPGAEFPANVESVYLAVSPDGSTLAFVAQRLGEPSSVWLRRIDEIASRPLAGSAGARSLAFSPDGRSLAFFAGGKLKRIDFDGGATVPICDAPAGTGLAASWGAGDQILFASVQGDSIYRVPAAGGTPEKVVVPDVSSGEFRVAWPQYLPDGLAFLYLGRSNDNQSRLMLVEPGASPRAVGPLDSRFELIAPDLLVFAREGALFAQRFDRASGRLVGPLSSIAPAVRYFYSSAWAGFATSPNGTIVLLDQESSHRLVWFDRQGRRQESVGPEGTYQHLSIAADGRSLLASRIQPGFGTHDLWLTDLARGVETRLTSSPDADFGGLMHPDGRSLIYSRVAGATAPTMARRDLGTGGEQVLLSRPTFQFATDISRDGRFLAFVERGEEGKFHASVLGLDGRSEPQRLFAPTSGEGDVRFSPDGRYVAYLSDESGTWEAYVSPLAGPGAKTRLSLRGASRLRWSRAGREILVLTPERQLVAVPVEPSPTLQVGMPVTLFTVAPESIWIDFDVAPDGRRFLAIVRERSGGAQPATAILGWRPPSAKESAQ